MGTAGACCVAVALMVEYGLAVALNASAMNTIIFMMLGGMVGMLGSNALARPDGWAAARASFFFPIALGIGLLLGIAVNPYQLPSLATFVLVMFAAVYIRRFGLNYFFAGFLVWMGYFFADLLHAQLADFPVIMLAIVVATAVVLILCVSVFRPHPRRTLARIFRSMNARARNLAQSCAALIDAADDKGDRRRALRRVVRARRHARETALMSDGWAAHAPALPVGWTATTLRHRLLDSQLNFDRLVAAADALSRESEDIRRHAVSTVSDYATGNDRTAALACARLEERAQTWPDTPRRHAGYLVTSILNLTTSRPNPDEPPETTGEFTPATELMLGNLPGSVSVARDVAARGAGWNPLARLRLTTRQAIQVAVAGGLAIIAGSALSEQRYYWAAIAAFVAFTGTGSRVETFRKSFNRVLGTVIGLVAGIFTANLTSGHTIWALVIVVVSIFFGFYLVRVSYAYMIFFVTIMVSQLYGILGEFSDELLLLRLEETAIGAAIGIVIALVVTPLSTRDTIAHAEKELLETIASAIDTAGQKLEQPTKVSIPHLDGLMFSVDNALRRLELVVEPLTRHYLWERRPREVRRRLALFTACVSSTRELVMSVRSPDQVDASLALAYRAAASAARPAADGTSPEPDIDPETLPALPETASMPVAENLPVDATVARELVRLQDLLGELADA